MTTAIDQTLTHGIIAIGNPAQPRFDLLEDEVPSIFESGVFRAFIWILAVISIVGYIVVKCIYENALAKRSVSKDLDSPARSPSPSESSEPEEEPQLEVLATGKTH